MAEKAETKKLLARARGGDMDAFAALFEGFRPLLHRLAYRLVGPNDCEDVVMDTYLKVWKALPGFRGRSSLKNWLCRVLRNCALDHLRQRQRRDARHVITHDTDDGPAPVLEAMPDETSPGPDRQAELSDLGTILSRAVAQLSIDHRTALLLREVDGFSYKEVAAATGVAVGTVMSRLFNAKRRLRQLLKESEL